MRLRWGVLLLAALGMGCSAARVVRLDTGTGESIVHVPRTDVAPVRLEQGEFKEVVTELARDVRPFEHPLRDARRLFGMPTRSGSYLYEGRSQRLRADRWGRRAQASHRHHPQREVSRPWRPLDAAVQAILQEGRDGAEGFRECGSPYCKGHKGPHRQE